MKITSVMFVLMFAFSAVASLRACGEEAASQVQSRFRGPVALKVWKHVQPSWNVEDATADGWAFELERGFSASGSPYVRIQSRTAGGGTVAQLSCSALVRTGEWEVKRQESTVKSVAASTEARDASFLFERENAVACLDVSEKRIVTEIRFKILNGDHVLHEQTLLPMYVRGRGLFYWRNPVEPYAAHGGEGDITVATAMGASRGDWDTWGGVLARPTANYFERNTLRNGAAIGLHRHEQNQEMFLVESGEAEMTMGVASLASEPYPVARRWSGTSDALINTTQRDARGGWIETRRLQPGQAAVIVPDPSKPNTVYFHGIKAQSDLLFWVFGTLN
jgi:hypothetical protein